MERSEQTLAGITDVLAQLVEKLPAAAGAPQLAAPLPPATSPQIVASTTHVEQPRLDNLAGECSAVPVPWASAASVGQSGNTCIGDDPSGASPCLPIHMHVAEKEKQKIWADVYVDLIALLNENRRRALRSSSNLRGGWPSPRDIHHTAPKERVSLLIAVGEGLSGVSLDLFVQTIASGRRPCAPQVPTDGAKYCGARGGLALIR